MPHTCTLHGARGDACYGRLKSWSQADLDQLERDLTDFFGRWKDFNTIDTSNDDSDDDLVQYRLKQKVACANSIVRAIRTIGAPCFNSSAVTEKAHQRPNHGLRLSKGKNRMRNSLRQVVRLDFLNLRKVRTEADEAARIAADLKEKAAEAVDATRAATQGTCAVMRKFGRGVDSKREVLRGMELKEIARICHCIRMHMESLRLAAVEANAVDLRKIGADEEHIKRLLPPASHVGCL